MRGQYHLLAMCLLTVRYLAAEIKQGPQRIGACRDDGLQILLPQSGRFTPS
jgi:hypothetical protein